MATTLSSQTWTLRFKHHRSTFLLHIDPLQNLSSVKAELLKAIQQTHPDGNLGDLSIPQNSSEILLARPKDINDLSMGWESIEPARGSILDADDSGKGKGKASGTPQAAAGGKAKASKNAALDCPQALGLRDGGMVAFKFRSEDDADERRDDDFALVDEDGKDDALRVDQEKPEHWDVVLPSWDETYDDAMEQDDR